MKRIFLITFLSLAVLAPGLTYAGLVPCGNPANDPQTPDIDETDPCTLCHAFVMLNNIIRFVMTTLVPVIAVLMLVIGGVLFFFAGAKPDTLKQAQGIITSVVIGILIIFSAWIIVNTLLSFSGIVSSSSLLEWYNIGCSI